jgi:hypothetical protein
MPVITAAAASTPEMILFIVMLLARFSVFSVWRFGRYGPGDEQKLRRC